MYIYIYIYIYRTDRTKLETRIMENKHITQLIFTAPKKMGRQRNPVISVVGYSAIKHVMNEG